MLSPGRHVLLKDATLREGLDTPGVSFSVAQRQVLARQLAKLGVAELEVVAPARVLPDLELAGALRAEGSGPRISGLVYASSPAGPREIAAAAQILDRFDVLMPLSPRREPQAPEAKIRLLVEFLALASREPAEVGAGFPHATQADPGFLLEIIDSAVRAGARRITIYDTNGSGDPFAIHALLAQVRSRLATELFFHAHDDLGLATANSFAAVRAGADGLDVTVNGLGDRAGNAALEQIALLLQLRGFDPGIRLSELAATSRLVEELSGVAVAPLAPVVGQYVLSHRSPGHLPAPDQFEAFEPALIGRHRSLEPDHPRAAEGG
jgi:homocitrate synthase NifV